MVDVEQLQFRRMLAASTAFHTVILGTVLVTTSYSPRHYVDVGSKGPINVMWASTVHLPAETAPNKLPGPAVALPSEVLPAPPQPKYVMPEDLQKMDRSKIEEARRKAMTEAVASVRRTIDDRPIPRADNYPSKWTRNAEEGLPSGPGGLAGVLGGSPVFTEYKDRIRQIIIRNWIWIQQRGAMKTEVIFTIDEQGNISNLSVSKSSGDPSFDASALRAVRKSSPLPAPPDEIAQSLIKEGLGLIFDPNQK
ncbi:MAG: cell envelope integrity protein TolA [Pseudomonadota bacterium]